MSWNYRVVKRTYDTADSQLPYQPEIDVEYAIYEVYYNERGEVTTISEEPVFPVGETLEELNRALIDYYTCYDKPCLIYEDIIR